MADISKINAVLIANIAEIDDVLAANIAKVNGLVFSTAPAFTGLLDTYTGAAAAYSTRRLYSLYTGAALRVREDSGDTETDIGFDSNGDLDTAAIAAHCGSANGYVTKWYGQESSGGTGSGNDAEQSTSGSQPQIYNGTAVITNENGNVAIELANGRNMSTLTQFNIATHSAFMVVQGTSARRAVYTFGDFNKYEFNIWNSSLVVTFIGGSADTSTATTDSVTHLFGAIYDASTIDVYIDGSQDYTAARTTTGTDELTFGGRNAATIYASEFVMWDSDQTSNQSGIEGNINAHYQIGNFGTPTSGLLYDYSGAAAAYSVRQLANTAALAMRIREDGTDTETDIGFDANGDLDTAAIASHCGSNNGYVVTWYDQAGSQLDATQGTSGNQPQIYDGASVVGDNGKPALDFDGANSGDRLEISTSLGITGTTSRSFYCVLNPHAAGTPSVTRTYIGLGDGTTAANSDKYNLSAEWSVRVYGGNEVYSSVTTNTQYLSTNIHNGTNVTDNSFYLNGSEQTATSSGSTTLATSNTVQYIAADGSGGVNRYNGTIQEVLIWASDQSSNRSGIETNINTYFSIY